MGNFYEGNVVWEGGVRMTLPDGKWEAVAKWEWTVNAVTANGITLVQLDGNLVKGMIDFSHVDSTYIEFCKLQIAADAKEYFCRMPSM